MDFIVHFDTGEPVAVKDATEAEVRDGILHIRRRAEGVPATCGIQGMVAFSAGAAKRPGHKRVHRPYGAYASKVAGSVPGYGIVTVKSAAFSTQVASKGTATPLASAELYCTLTDVILVPSMPSDARKKSLLQACSPTP